MSKTVSVEDGVTYAYVAAPRPLWFDAGNPVRQPRLKASMPGIADDIARRMAAADLPHLQEDLDTTLALTAIGRVARESGVQADLIACLSRLRADCSAAVRAAAGHGEVAALEGGPARRGGSLLVAARGG
ncbi:MAG: hypothetical protein AAF281_16875 [Pseudomonadota bacterium]